MKMLMVQTVHILYIYIIYFILYLNEYVHNFVNIFTFYRSFLFLYEKENYLILFRHLKILLEHFFYV